MNKKPPFSYPFFTGESEESLTQGADNPMQGRNENRAREAYAAQDDMGSLIPEAEHFPGGVIPEDAAGTAQAAEEQLIDDETLAVLCKMRICPECPVKKEAEDTQLRALADLDNARKRLAREKEEFTKFAAERVLSDILPSIDNLDLALHHAGDSPACKDLATGVSMTRNLLLDSLKKHGLQAVGAVGEEFDPAVHEAVGMEYVEGIPENHISTLLARGYTLNNRLLRPARVMVCKKE